MSLATFSSCCCCSCSCYPFCSKGNSRRRRSRRRRSSSNSSSWRSGSSPKQGSKVLFPGALPLASAGVGGYVYHGIYNYIYICINIKLLIIGTSSEGGLFLRIADFTIFQVGWLDDIATMILILPLECQSIYIYIYVYIYIESEYG